MSDIFGPHTKMSVNERDVMYALWQRNSVVYPIFNSDRQRDCRIYYEAEKNFPSTFTGSKEIDTFQGGVIIPFDMLDIRPGQRYRFDQPPPPSAEPRPKDQRRKTNGIDAQKNGPAPQQYFTSAKYVSQPDFIYAMIEDDRIDLIPIDIKKNANLRSGGQVSAYNLAWLLDRSPFLAKIVNDMERRYDRPAMINAGAYLIYGTHTEPQDGLEEYIAKYLKGSDNEYSEHGELQGIDARRMVPQLVTQDLLFSATLTYYAQAVGEGNYRLHIRRVKHNIERKGYYPSQVIAVSGFNGNGFPKLLLEYDPLVHVRTLNPLIEQIQKTIIRIQTLRCDEIEQTYTRQRDIYIQELTHRAERLEGSIQSDEDKRREILSEMRHVRDEYGKGGHIKKVERNLYHKIEQSENTLTREEITIRIKRERLERIRREITTARTYYYNSRPEKGTTEWWKLVEGLRTRRIASHQEELDAAEKKLQERQTLDARLTTQIDNFRNALPRPISDNGLFQHPRELYFGLNGEVYFHINMFSSIHLL